MTVSDSCLAFQVIAKRVVRASSVVWLPFHSSQSRHTDPFFSSAAPGTGLCIRGSAPWTSLSPYSPAAHSLLSALMPASHRAIWKSFLTT